MAASIPEIRISIIIPQRNKNLNNNTSNIHNYTAEIDSQIFQVYKMIAGKPVEDPNNTLPDLTIYEQDSPSEVFLKHKQNNKIDKFEFELSVNGTVKPEYLKSENSSKSSQKVTVMLKFQHHDVPQIQQSLGMLNFPTKINSNLYFNQNIKPLLLTEFL